MTEANESSKPLGLASTEQLGPNATGRPCTCHPDDNPPQPCAKRYALSECKAAATTLERWGRVELPEANGGMFFQRVPDGYWTPWHVAEHLQAALAEERDRLRAALRDVVGVDWAYSGADADTGNPESLYSRVKRGRALGA